MGQTILRNKYCDVGTTHAYKYLTRAGVEPATHSAAVKRLIIKINFNYEKNKLK